VGNYCINQLMNELAPEDMFVTEKHRERWAWVVSPFSETSASTLKGQDVHSSSLRIPSSRFTGTTQS
jgi:hypothetical protein